MQGTNEPMTNTVQKSQQNKSVSATKGEGKNSHGTIPANDTSARIIRFRAGVKRS